MEPVDNRKILASLEQEFNLLKTAYGISSAATITGFATGNAVGTAIGAATDYFLLERIEKICRIHRVATMLVDAFTQSGVTIFPRIQVPRRNPLDLFVKFPKASLIISIRSMGKAKIVYNENQGYLYAKKANNKGLKIWSPDPMTELSEYTLWLNKNKELFGLTARQIRHPRAKLLVLSGETQIHKHNEHLYTTMNDKTFLAIPKFGTIFVIREEMLVDFAQAFKASKHTVQVEESLNP